MYSEIKLGNVTFGESENRCLDYIDEEFKPEGSEPDGKFIIFKKANYVKQGLDISLRLQIDPNKYAGASGNQANDLNYCSINNYKTNEFGTPEYQGARYYFIRSIEWASNSVCTLKLHMDVLNSFGAYDYLDDRTHVLREHRDRFRVEGAKIVNGKIKAARLIDRNKEGITFPKYKNDSEVLNKEFTLDSGLDFYLMYMNQNDPSEAKINPVKCFLIPSQKLKLTNGGTATPPKVFGPSNFIPNTYYYLTYADNPNGLFGQTGDEVAIEKKVIWKFWNDGKYIARQKLQYDENHSFVAAGPKVQDVELTFNVMKQFRVLTFSTNNYSQIANSPQIAGINAGAVEDLYWKSISSIDTTDPKIIKILMLPYSPIHLVFSPFDDTLSIPEGWKINTEKQLLELTDLSKEFKDTLEFRPKKQQPFKELSVFLPLKAERDEMFHSPVVADENEPESKLFSSEFYNPTIYYDSFSLNFSLENFSEANLEALPPSNGINIVYKVTNTINSRFLFDFIDYKKVTAESIQEENYPSILFVNRNNEVTLYNNTYINYIRNGFNYDVKSKQRQEISSGIGVGLNLVGTIASIMSAPATGGLSLVGAVGLGTATVSSLVGAINTRAQLEQNFEQKQRDLKMQATAIAGADDVDLMKYYGTNKLFSTIYQIRKENMNLLKNLFFYYGYKCDYYGRPNIASRNRFNFLQAEILPSQMYAEGYTAEIKEEIIAKYKEGVTFIHAIKRQDGTYYQDIRQWRDNWEVSLDEIG